jgi:hypothetical protein
MMFAGSLIHGAPERHTHRQSPERRAADRLAAHSLRRAHSSESQVVICGPP